MSRHLLNVAADDASSHHPADESSSASWARATPYSEQRGARKNGAEPVHAETTYGTGMPPALAIFVQPVPLPADITGRAGHSRTGATRHIHLTRPPEGRLCSCRSGDTMLVDDCSNGGALPRPRWAEMSS